MQKDLGIVDSQNRYSVSQLPYRKPNKIVISCASPIKPTCFDNFQIAANQQMAQTQITNCGMAKIDFQHENNIEFPYLLFDFF